MGSEPVSESHLPSPVPVSVRPTGSASGALKPPLPPAFSARPSPHAPSGSVPVNHQQIAQQAAIITQDSVPGVGRHQSAAVPDSEPQRLSLDAVRIPHAPQQSLGQQASPKGQLRMSRSPEKVSPQQPVPQEAESPGMMQSPDQQPKQQASPMTSPFKKVPSPWEKADQHKAANQSSPSPALQQPKKQLLGKRKHISEETNPEPAVSRLQHIISQTDSTVKDRMRDSVLLDTLHDVPDDQPMPVSVEDRGTGMGDTAASNTKDSIADRNKIANQDLAGSGKAGDSTSPDDIIDMTTDADRPAIQPGAKSASQPLGFDDTDDPDFESGLIAAVDQTSIQHGVQHQQPPHSSAADAAADQLPSDQVPTDQVPSDQIPSDILQHQPAGSKAASIIHQQQNQQQYTHERQLGQEQHEQLNQQPDQQLSQHPEQQQQLLLSYSSVPPDVAASTGVSGSLPTPSEVGLGEYGSTALDPGPSVGVSSTLPSFDLDAEMASLDKQTKVRNQELYLNQSCIIVHEHHHSADLQHVC